MAKDEKSNPKKRLIRKPERYPVDISTTFRIKGEQEWHRGTLVNLSTGGFCLQTSTPLRSNLLIEFIFDTIDKSRRKHRRIVVAKVVWKRLTRHGVQFVRSMGKKGSI
jgi:hypothetical protein